MEQSLCGHIKLSRIRCFHDMSYVCYLLQSQPKPKSFYIGSTNAPERRLRQHNGEIAMGARRTMKGGKQPWSMICIVSGFKSQIAALQFEHAWQHPHTTRHIEVPHRISKNRGQLYGDLARPFGNLRLLLRSSAFSRLGLRVHLLEEQSRKLWEANKYQVKCAVEVSNVYGKMTTQVEKTTTTERRSSVLGSELSSPSSSSLSSPRSPLLQSLSPSSEACTVPSSCVHCCPSCSCPVDLIELATLFLKDHPEHVLPVSGPCPVCEATILWKDVVPDKSHSDKPKSKRKTVKKSQTVEIE